MASPQHRHPKINDAVVCEYPVLDRWGKPHPVEGVFRVVAIAQTGEGVVYTPSGIRTLTYDREWRIVGRYSRFPFLLFRRFVANRSIT